MNNLNDKIILVTGGSGLLGKAMLEDIKAQGGIAINGDINVGTDIKNLNVQLDVTSTASINAALNAITDHYGRIDGLVNNAYPRTLDWGNKFEDVSIDSWRKNVDLQLNHVFEISQMVLKIMSKKKTAGSIVNLSSIYGVVGNDFTVYEGTELSSPAAYAAIKGGIINFTRYLASYYGPQQIRVNCVSPGGIFNHQPEQFVANYEKKVPMKRMGQATDIAPAVSFLLSDSAGYITGHNLVVDGGWTAI